jgi:uncharacterized protein (UPF0303 family)
MSVPGDLAKQVAGLEKELDGLQLSRFTNDDAIALGMLVVETARREGHRITVDIRRGGQQLFHAALPGTSADNDGWIDRKVRVAERFGRASLLVRHDLELKEERVNPSLGLDPLVYAVAGGAVPLVVRDVGPVGTLTVSGLPQEDDHDLVVRALHAFLEAPGEQS